MSAREAAVLVFVWIAIQAGVSATLLVQYAVFTMSLQDTSLVERIIALVPVAFLLWVAFRLVRDRFRFARAVFPDAAENEPAVSESAATPHDLGVLAVAGIGLYVLVAAAPEFLTWVFEMPGALQGQYEAENNPLSAGRVLAAVVDTAAGWLLVVNREAAAEWLLKRTEPSAA